jgi:hypothetical protein
LDVDVELALALIEMRRRLNDDRTGALPPLPSPLDALSFDFLEADFPTASCRTPLRFEVPAVAVATSLKFPQAKTQTKRKL